MTTPNHWTISLDRHEFTTHKSWDDVVAGIDAGLGHPDFPSLQQQLDGTTDWDRFKDLVAGTSGSAGLMVFLRLDLGAVVSRDPDADDVRALRIIAGNPVTMESMVRTEPGAGAWAPVTILVFERADGVHVRYDTVVSALDLDADPAAVTAANGLDDEVLTLLRAATAA